MARRLLTRLNLTLSIITSLSLIGGLIIFFVFERPDARLIEQKQSTLRYVAMFQEGAVGRSRTALSRSWFAEAENLKQLGPQSVASPDDDVPPQRNAPPVVLQRLASLVVDQSPKDGSEQDLAFAVFRVAEFFDSLNLCVSSGICDEDSARKYFKPFAENFLCLYAPIVDRFKKDVRMTELGDGLTKFAGDDIECLS